jgi:hypothetical protein
MKYTSWRLIRRTDAKRSILRSHFHSEFFVSAGFFLIFALDDHLTTTPSRPLAFLILHDFTGLGWSSEFTASRWRISGRSSQHGTIVFFWERENRKGNDLLLNLYDKNTSSLFL